jgi:hypothetical protein
MRIFSKALIGLGLLLASGACAMADTLWTLNDVYFSDGNQATGWFVTNTAATIVESFSLQVTGPDSATAFTATQMSSAYLPDTIGFATTGWTEFADLYLAAPLTSAGGTIDIAGGYDCPLCGTLLDNSNYTPSVTGTVTPEPLTAPFVGVSVAAMAWVVRRRRLARSL